MEEQYAESEEFSQQRLIDEDQSMKLELMKMKNGLVRKRSVSSSRSSFSSTDSNPLLKRQRSDGSFGGSFLDKTGSLSIALKSNRKMKHRTSFLGGAKSGETKDIGGLIHKSISLSHVVFRSCDNQSRSTLSKSSSSRAAVTGKRKERDSTVSLFKKVSGQ